MESIYVFSKLGGQGTTRYFSLKQILSWLLTVDG